MPLVLVGRAFIKHSKGRVAACVRGVAPCSCRMPVCYALSNSLGFGGHNACLLFKKWEG